MSAKPGWKKGSTWIFHDHHRERILRTGVIIGVSNGWPGQLDYKPGLGKYDVLSLQGPATISPFPLHLGRETCLQPPVFGTWRKRGELREKDPEAHLLSLPCLTPLKEDLGCDLPKPTHTLPVDGEIWTRTMMSGAERKGTR